MEENIITSVQNARIKHVVALQQKSSLRREEGLFVVEGQREIEHCIACGYEITELFVIDSLGYSGDIPATVVTPQVYEKMAYRERTEGIIAIAKCKEHRLENLLLKEKPLVVVIESVEKPGNLGAILRASIGGVFSVPVAVCNSKDCIAFLKAHKIRILTAQLQDSYDYYDYDMHEATAIVMGTESTGLTQQWREAADAHIRIPMLGRLDSLNVSVSAAILMYEAVRQRNSKYQNYTFGM